MQDRASLVGTALLVCMIGVGSFLLAEIYQVHRVWLFVAWNSIFFVPAMGREFRSQFKRPFFVAFFIAWACLHGLFIVGLMRWVPFVYWWPVIIVELFIGYAAANILFGVLPETTESDNPKQE